MKIVAATGCFDVLHYGHFKLLEFAAEHGRLLVGIDSDHSYRRWKKREPVHFEWQRAYNLSRVQAVSEVIVFDSCLQFLVVARPQIWVKGADYSLDTLNPAEVKVCRKYGIEILFVPHTGHSSSDIRRHASYKFLA